jgi:hypothetical protein
MTCCLQTERVLTKLNQLQEVFLFKLCAIVNMYSCQYVRRHCNYMVMEDLNVTGILLRFFT